MRPRLIPAVAFLVVLVSGTIVTPMIIGAVSGPNPPHIRRIKEEAERIMLDVLYKDWSAKDTTIVCYYLLTEPAMRVWQAMSFLTGVLFSACLAWAVKNILDEITEKRGGAGP